MDLQHPTNKMSKSADSPQGTILRARRPEGDHQEDQDARSPTPTTRSASTPRPSPASRTCSQILGSVTDRTTADLEAEYAGSGYGTLKGAVADAVVEYVRPLQERYDELAADPAEVARILSVGADRAREPRRAGDGPCPRRSGTPSQGALTGMPEELDDDVAPDSEPNPRYRRRSEDLEFDRVAFFSDAVFAIAMTLLVVGIGIPHVRDASSASISATRTTRSSRSS